jgi:MoxR-like ATPase
MTTPSKQDFAAARTLVAGIHQQLTAVRHEIAQHVYGQEEVITQTLLGILAGGHVLLKGVPGLAKTTLVTVLGTVLGLEHNRIQCTPDLMPSDILGAEVVEQDTSGKRAFRLIKGAVFTQLLMADEINRASPKTQSALLQAMQEQQVTLAGTTYPLPRPFHVLATLNPLEHEGTYPLPEAQLDRFLLEIILTYPTAAIEREIALKTTGMQQTPPVAKFSPAALEQAQNLVREMPIAERVADAVIALVQHTRPEQNNDPFIQKYVQYGAGPRASQALLLTTRAHALLEERFAPSLDDIDTLALPVLRHRLGLTYQARADGISTADVVQHVWTGLRQHYA